MWTLFYYYDMWAIAQHKIMFEDNWFNNPIKEGGYQKD